MKSIYPLIPVVFLLILSCGDGTHKDPIEQWKDEIVETEKDFATMVQEVGINEAFMAYAAEDAVMMRNDSLVIGKEEISDFLSGQRIDTSMTLNWKPDFVDVSTSGDLGYTYGRYTFSFMDSTGTRIQRTGVFHTVWKKQPDGTWRFVWD